METQKEKEAICCPPFDPTIWEDKIIEWENKKFIKDKVFTLFYMPVNFGGVMRRLMKKIGEANADVPEWLCLSDHTSQWNMNLYVAVDKEVPGANNTTIGGKFYCKVYEGPFRDTGKWCKDFVEKANAKGMHPQKLFMWYTTCPKCAKKYGKNYVAIFAQIE
ncbi:hydrolase [Bacteroides sedimenti]|uniref:Uncharacterized protein n=1 Tax=Bacteroides sedimenti TaxID=2136147 RepID=A0ABN6ZF69_9BACE